MLIKYNCSCNHQAGRWFGAQKDYTVSAIRLISSVSSSVETILVRMCDACKSTVPAEKEWTNITPYTGPAEDPDPPPPIHCSIDACENEAGGGGFCDGHRCEEDDCENKAESYCNRCNDCCDHFNCPACSGHKAESVKCSRCSNCISCCNCFTCTSCNTKYDLASRCEYCLMCSSCCSCEICSECSSRVHANDSCGYCHTHCECANNRRGYGGPWKADLPKHRVGFNSTRLAGVEWEFNNAAYFNKLGPWTKRWHGGIHADGSCGQEIVTSPMAGDHISKCLTQLGEAFKNAGANIDHRCGIHVHVDACDVTWSDMYRLLWLYSHVEPILFMLAGQQRIGNTYCLPCGAAYKKAMGGADRKGGVLEVAFSSARNGGNSGRSHQRQHPGKKDGGRYRALNLCPWLAGRKNKAPDTTLEFRLHCNTSEADRVIGWTQLCVRLVDWAVKSTDKDAQELPKSALRTLCQIAPECAPYIMKCVKEWRKKYKASKTGGDPRKIYFRNGRYSI